MVEMKGKAYIFTLQNPLREEPVTFLISRGTSFGNYLIESFDGAYKTPRVFNDAVEESERLKNDLRVYNVTILTRKGVLKLAEKLTALTKEVAK